LGGFSGQGSGFSFLEAIADEIVGVGGGGFKTKVGWWTMLRRAVLRRFVCGSTD
jgi:hypothetical protein